MIVDHRHVQAGGTSGKLIRIDDATEAKVLKACARHAGAPPRQADLGFLRADRKAAIAIDLAASQFVSYLPASDQVLLATASADGLVELSEALVAHVKLRHAGGISEGALIAMLLRLAPSASERRLKSL